jgi:hypothetical protein
LNTYKFANIFTGDSQQKDTDRIAVVVTSLNTSKLLGIPKVASGTGQMQAENVHQLLIDWNLAGKIVGMSFDTTSANTGIHKGACTILEQMLEKNLLYLACRHHILELLAGNAFHEVFGSTTSPTVKLFENFRKNWTQIDVQVYHPLESTDFKKLFLRQLRNEAVEFLRNV